MFLLAAVLALSAQSVQYVAPAKTFVLQLEESTYALGVNDLNRVQHVYWGPRLQRPADFTPPRAAAAYAFESREGMTQEEYPAFGGMRYGEPALKASHSNGIRDIVLGYVSHEISGDTLKVRTKDITADLFVTLCYRVWPRRGILARWAEIENRTSQPVTVENAQSALWHLPDNTGYRLTYLAGRWAGETQLERELLGPGRKVMESRRGNTSHQANPWFALDEGDANEDRGRVWFGALAWSGNWKITVEQTTSRQLRVAGGMNDFDFAYPLAPGATLVTPEFHAGFTQRGFGDASRLLHRFVLTELAPDRRAPKPRPVLYNSWEATTFSVDEPGQKDLATKARALGVELFVMDDGWFGARDHDKAGLGDWFVNKKKFPNGLGGLIDHVHGLGMQFGLWVEPEMVNPDSDLYRAHPDWAIHLPGRPRTEQRNQLMLNMALPAVRDHIFKVLDDLLTQNKIDFIKWDMNRHISEPGLDRALYVNYVRNVYAIIDQLRAKHPKLEIESCSGGGGRADLETLKRVDQVWTSDNTEAFDRLRIQEGFSFAYPAKVMMDWVTDVPNMNGRSTPLKYRFLVAMQGSLGIGANLHHWKDADNKLAAEMIARYKTIRSTVQEGNLFRLASPSAGALTANQYVSADGRQSVLFAFLDHQQFRQNLSAIRLKGLDPLAVYKLTTIDDKLIPRQREFSGSWLMGRGLDFRLTGDYDSTMVILEKQ